MTALSTSRVPPQIAGQLYHLPVAASTLIYGGALVVVDSNGHAKPGSTALNLRAIGVADGLADNSNGSAGDVFVRVRAGIFGFKNSADADEITAAEIGHTCYIADDQTVAKTSATNTRSPAGAVRMIEGGLVFVDVGMPSSIDGDLVASNNLSDVASAATARANIGANKVALHLHIDNLVGADATVYRLVSPVAGDINAIHSVLNAPLATGNATITAAIGATPITNGVVTITQAGSAAGDVDSATPSAAKTVSIGDVIHFTVGGTNDDADATADITILIET